MNRPKLSNYCEVLEARGKYVNVQLRLNVLEKQSHDLNQQVIDDKENTDHQVDDYLNGKNYEYKDMQQERISSLEKINGERRIAAKALGKAKRVVYEAEYKAKKDIVKNVGPEYKEVAKRLSKALIAVQEISDEEMSIRGILGKEGIEIAAFIPSCAFRPALGNNTEDGHFSIIGHYHRMQVKNGYLKPTDISKKWCKAWSLDSIQADGQSKGNGEDRPETIVKQNEDGWLNFN